MNFIKNSPESTISHQKFFKEDNFGNNIILDIDLARHGEKGSFNSARIENAEETFEMAKNEDLSDYDIVAIRTTPVERAVHTAQVTREGFLNNKTFRSDTVNIRVRELPTGVHSSEGVNIKKILGESDASKDVNLISQHIREQYKLAVQNKEGSSWKKESAGVELFINLMQSNLKVLERVINDLKSGVLSEEAKKEIEKFKADQKNEGGMSILEVVLRMAKHLQNYTKVTNKLKSDTKVYIHEVSHSGFIEPFLIYLLNKKIIDNPINPDGKTDLEKLGGGFKPNEKLRINIERQERGGPVKLSFQLRGRTYKMEIDDTNNNKLAQSEELLNLIKLYE